MNNTLLPCPFCGGEAEETNYNSDDYTISCKKCAAEIGWRKKAESIAAWNRRADHIRDATKKVTNADRIRSMSDEELAREILFFVPSDFNRHYTGIAGGYYATADEAIQANFDWLQQPVKEE